MSQSHPSSMSSCQQKLPALTTRQYTALWQKRIQNHYGHTDWQLLQLLFFLLRHKNDNHFVIKILLFIF
jgi:hypothetical protein